MGNNINTETKKVLVLAGPSGSGKSTLARLLMHEYERFSLAVSATTRHIRLGETHGKNYYFLTSEEFEEKIVKGEFIEWEEVYPDKFYGSLKSEISRINEMNKKILYEIDVKAALRLKEYFGSQAHVVFIKADDRETLEKRLRNLGVETEEEFQTRLGRYDEEFALEDQFDDSVINYEDNLESAKQQLREIILDHFTAETRVTSSLNDGNQETPIKINMEQENE